jgi:hypothetical protein
MLKKMYNIPNVITKTFIVVLVFFCCINDSMGQNGCLSDRDYSVYNYLINKTINKLDSSIAHLDSVKVKIKYVIKIKDSTIGDPYLFSQIDTADKIYSFQDVVGYDKLNKNNCVIEKDKLVYREPLGLRKIKDKTYVKVEFGRCWFYNDNKYVIVYYGEHYGPLSGQGSILILKNDGNGWSVIMKKVIWVS